MLLLISESIDINQNFAQFKFCWRVQQILKISKLNISLPKHDFMIFQSVVRLINHFLFGVLLTFETFDNFSYLKITSSIVATKSSLFLLQSIPMIKKHNKNIIDFSLVITRLNHLIASQKIFKCHSLNFSALDLSILLSDCDLSHLGFESCAKLSRNWIKIVLGLSQNWVKIESKLSQNWIKIVLKTESKLSQNWA